MAQAKYTVLVPNYPGLSHAVGQYLTDGPIQVKAMNIVQGDPYIQVVAWAEENPETDSHFKQIGTYAGEAANEQTISVLKEGKSGVSTWEMRNKHYQPVSVHDDLTHKPSGDLGDHLDLDPGPVPPEVAPMAPMDDGDQGSPPVDDTVNQEQPQTSPEPHS